MLQPTGNGLESLLMIRTGIEIAKDFEFIGHGWRLLLKPMDRLCQSHSTSQSNGRRKETMPRYQFD